MKVLNTFVGLICLLPSFVFAKHTLLNKNGEIYIKLDDASKINQAFTNEILEKIGNPYISSKNNENSMGLGIFIAKNLIENIGGKMKFYNKINNLGSVVDISLNRNN